MDTTVKKLGKLSPWINPGADSSARLALDLAIRIKPVDQICQDYDIDKEDLKRRLMNDKQLQLQITEYREIWNHPMNAKERVKIKSQVMAEDALGDVWKIMTNPDTAPNIRIDAHKHLSKLAEVEPKRDASEQGSRFSVTINLPGQEKMEVVAESELVSEEINYTEDAA